MIGIGAEDGKGSRRHIVNSRGRRWTASEKGAGSRVHGISVIYQRLALKSNGYGGLVVFSELPEPRSYAASDGL